MNKTLSVAVISLVVGLFAGYALTKKANTLDKTELIKAQHEYYNACEALLDEIEERHPEFCDTDMESDEYCDYSDARSKVDSLLNLEL